MRFLSKKEVCYSDLKIFGLVNYLDRQNLTASIAFVRLFSKALVNEFYANLNKFMTYPNYARFEKIYVREYVIEFSHRLINRFVRCFTCIDEVIIDEIPNLDVIYGSITGKEACYWPSCRYINASELTMK